MNKYLIKITILIVSLVVIILTLSTYFYPFSTLSVYEQYTYEPDPLVVDGYIENLDEFKDQYENDSEEDQTVYRTRYILEMFEQDWLISTEPKEINEQELYNMLFEVQQVRKNLFDLVHMVDYSKLERNYLVMNVKNMINLEEQIKDVINASFLSRSELDRRIRNIHSSFNSSFLQFNMFYRTTQHTQPESQ